MIGKIIRVQTPMYITFDDEEVEFLASTLEDALIRSYQIIDFFLSRDEDEEEEW